MSADTGLSSQISAEAVNSHYYAELCFTLAHTQCATAILIPAAASAPFNATPSNTKLLSSMEAPKLLPRDSSR